MVDTFTPHSSTSSSQTLSLADPRSPVEDLAGVIPTKSSHWQILRRINTLIDGYMSLEVLSDRLQDLPRQFIQPQPRPWRPIDWHAIDLNQTFSIHPQVLLGILVGAMETEAPIRAYSQTSRQYLEHLHPQLAKFVGGTAASDGSVVEIGLWEKEERRHTPALIKVYTQLTGEKFSPRMRAARAYQPAQDPYQDLYRHGLHRVATEYGATSLYLWLAAHSTGPLQQVFVELMIDEINHLAKYWGFGCWAFPETGLPYIGQTLLSTLAMSGNGQGSLIRTLNRLRRVLHWTDWSLSNQLTMMFTLSRILRRLSQWSTNLTPDYLQDLFGVLPARSSRE
jgi:hypothetical protein